MTTGGGGVSGLWMLFNQQQLLMLFLAINSYIHNDVRVFIKKQNFLLFNFNFIPFPIPNIFGIKETLQNYKQQFTWMNELGYTSMSALWNNRNIFIILGIIISVQLVTSVCRYWINNKTRLNDGSSTPHWSIQILNFLSPRFFAAIYVRIALETNQSFLISSL